MNNEIFLMFLNIRLKLSVILPFRGRGESDILHNKGNYTELLEFVHPFDPLLESHFKESTV